MNTLRNNRDLFLPFGFDVLPKFETMAKTQNQLPAVNIKENDHQFEILLAVPGLNKKDFKIELNEDILTISSEIKKEENVQEENYSRKEFSYSSFKRSFTLPETVNEEKIEASYENGILNLILPKKEETLPKEKRNIIIA